MVGLGRSTGQELFLGCWSWRGTYQVRSTFRFSAATAINRPIFALFPRCIRLTDVYCSINSLNHELSLGKKQRNRCRASGLFKQVNSRWEY